MATSEIEKHLLANLHEFVGFAQKRLRDADLGADAEQGAEL